MSTTHAPTRRFSNILNAGEADSRRWLVLATICFAALMIVLDVTVDRTSTRLNSSHRR